MIRRRGKRDERQPSQHRHDPARFPNMRSNVVGDQTLHRDGLQGQVHQSRIRVLRVPLQGLQIRIRASIAILFALGNDTQEPILAQRGGVPGAGVEDLERASQHEGEGLLAGPLREGVGDAVPPELVAQGSYGGSGNGVGDAGEFDVEGADAEIGCPGIRGNEGDNGAGRGVMSAVERGVAVS